MSQVKMFAFDFAPKNFAKCDGALMETNQYAALYSLLGAQFGGDGTTNFNLPDLRGRVPVHNGEEFFTFGQQQGTETYTLHLSELPNHTHTLQSDLTPSSSSTRPNPNFTLCKYSGTPQLFSKEDPDTVLDEKTSSTVGANGAHFNMMPSLAINFCIALDGDFPPRN